MDSNPQEQIEKDYPRRHHEKLKKKFTALKLVLLLSSIHIILSITLWPIIKDGPEKIFFASSIMGCGLYLVAEHLSIHLKITQTDKAISLAVLVIVLR